jgi:hypothetical protein
MTPPDLEARRAQQQVMQAFDGVRFFWAIALKCLEPRSRLGVHTAAHCRRA